MKTLALLFVSATVLAAPSMLSEMVSLPRVAYILGRWFDGPHDGFKARCSGGDVDLPNIEGHESVAVGVSCGYETTLSSVVAGLDWVVETASSDATVIVPDHLRGHRIVEDRLDSMRECGMNVPGALVAAQSSPLPADFFRGFMLCVALIAMCTGYHRLFRTRVARPIERRYTWEMTARDRKCLADRQTYAGQADDQAAARVRRESFKSSRPQG
jgi:hypothetical protein